MADAGGEAAQKLRPQVGQREGLPCGRWTEDGRARGAGRLQAQQTLVLRVDVGE